METEELATVVSAALTIYWQPPSKGLMPGLLYLVPLTPQQAGTDPRLCWRLLDTHTQVWLSLLWGHCSFLLGPGVHMVLFVPFKALFPQSCGSSVSNPTGLQSQIPWGSQALCWIPRLGNLFWT